MIDNDQLVEAVETIDAWDDLEETHKQEALHALRTRRKDVHFVVYCPVMNGGHTSMLFVHHRGTRLWLPCGGHIEPMETPVKAAKREVVEELGVDLVPIRSCPEFLSVSPGEDDASHVCLWYVFAASDELEVTIDTDELISARWFDKHQYPMSNSDPHLGRFLGKLHFRGILLIGGILIL